MRLAKFATIAIIAAMYNIFLHILSSTIYKDSFGIQKLNQTTTFLIVIALLTLLLNYLLYDKKLLKNSVIYNGIKYGAIILIATVLLTNWENMNSEIFLLLSGILFCGLLWLSDKYFN